MVGLKSKINQNYKTPRICRRCGSLFS
jgi:hypothetical protein